MLTDIDFFIIRCHISWIICATSSSWSNSCRFNFQLLAKIVVIHFPWYSVDTDAFFRDASRILFVRYQYNSNQYLTYCNLHPKIMEKTNLFLLPLNFSIKHKIFFDLKCSGPTLANKLLSLCLEHYKLASTTVTGIPMKEEQNASSSANYDVELFHVAEAHAALQGDTGDLLLTKEECDYDTLCLIIIILIISVIIR